jgi:hypothetical protein
MCVFYRSVTFASDLSRMTLRPLNREPKVEARLHSIHLQLLWSFHISS